MGNYDRAETARRIRTRRKEDLDLKQAVIAERAGITLQTLSTYENGSVPRMDILWDLADALECEPDYLLGRIEHPKRSTSEISKLIPLSRKAIEALEVLNDIPHDTGVSRIFDLAIGLIENMIIAIKPTDISEDRFTTRSVGIDLLVNLNKLKKAYEKTAQHQAALKKQDWTSLEPEDFNKATEILEESTLNQTAIEAYRLRIINAFTEILDEYIKTFSEA